MRLIDADALHFNRIRIYHEDGTVGGYNAVVFSAEIKDAPTIYAVPVVRCKDCKWWVLSDHNTFDIHICKRCNGVRFESDFCSRAERREDGLE